LDSRDRETIIGAGVFLAGAVVLMLAYGVSGRSAVAGYDLVGHYNKADGVSVGTDVRLSGVTVGKVVGQALDRRYHAVVTMRVAPDIQLPDDTAAVIHTDGLLGGKFIALQPGGSETNLKPGGQFRYTQDSMDIEDLLEQIVAQGQANRSNDGNAGEQPKGR
jgi:phospholipid/cholesterol/gamma-HCH transport system substrate-binding protein